MLLMAGCNDAFVGLPEPKPACDCAAGAGGGAAIPNPLPVTMAQTPTAWVDDQRPEVVGPATIAWPPDAVAYSVQVVTGAATLVGCPAGDVPMVEGDRRIGGLPDGAEEFDTLTAWTELQVAAGGRVLLAFTLRS